MKIKIILSALIISLNAHASKPMEEVLDTACRVLHARASLSKETEGTDTFHKIYTQDVTQVHKKWRTLWVSATKQEKQIYLNLLQSLHEAQKIAFLFEKNTASTQSLRRPPLNQNVIQPSENMKTADRFLDIWKKASVSRTNYPILSTLQHTVFNRKKNLPPKTSITLEKTTRANIQKDVKITHPVMLEFLNGDTITKNVIWGSEQFAIKDGATLVGYVGLSNNTITPMYIFPHYQGKNYGHYAAVELIKNLKKRGVKTLRSIIDVLNMPSLLCRLGLGFTTDVNADSFGMEDYPTLFPGFLYTLDLDTVNFS